MSRISEYRRETILNAALAEFGTRGIEGASISEIAARAGIGKSTVYEYFTSKSELFLAVCKMKARQIMEEVCAVFAQDIPFASQLERGLPMTITDPRMRSFFMSASARFSAYPGSAVIICLTRMPAAV